MTDDALTIVTGASSNHFGCLCNLLTSIDRHEDAAVRVYDLGLTVEEAQRLRDGGRNVARFEFERYPSHFGRSADFAHPYSWKPVIIHDLLMESGHPVLWLDAGDLVHRRLERVRAQLRTVGFYSPTSVGRIVRWTHPLALERLGAAPDILDDRNRNGAIVGFGTNDLAREIVVAWRDAVMDKDIICPEGWTRKRHRSDQAILSVLVAQARRRYDFELANDYLDISIHNDSKTAEQAARLMMITADEARAEGRTAWRAKRAAEQEAKRLRVERKKRRSRGLPRLWHKLKKLARRVGFSATN